MDQSEAAREQKREGEQLFYLYCFARAGGVRSIAAPGVSDGGVATLNVDAVSAVFSIVPRDEFEGEAAARNVQDLAWVAPRAIRHEEVLEEVLQECAVLPVRFGTVFLSVQAMENTLRGHYGEVARFLADFSDKQEWCVKAFGDAAKAAEWLAANDPDLCEQKKCSIESPGARYFHHKRLQAEAGRRSRQMHRTWGGQIGDELRVLAAGVRQLRLQPMGVTGRKEDMLLNTAYLLHAGSVGNFRKRVDELASACAQRGVVVEASGPWPPYNFCPSIGGIGE